MNEFAQYAQALLPLAGGALQWVRQHSTVPESLTVVLAMVSAAAVYALCFDWGAEHNIQQALIEFLLWFGTIGVPAVLGGTFTASKLANTGKLPIPQTNSK